MRYTLYKTDGTKEDISSKAPFNLKALQTYVGGYIQMVPLPDGSELICNEEGLINGLPHNLQASEIWRRAYPIEQYPHANATFLTGIFGDVIHKQPRL